MTDDPTNKATIKATLILFALILTAGAQPQTITGKVVGIVDGDTLDILDAEKRTIRIRLQGVDSPESNQDFGSRAKQSLSDLVFGKAVTVYWSKYDRHKRPLGIVTLDGRDINLEQINRGMAWFYRQYVRELSRDDATAYEQAEAADHEMPCCGLQKLSEVKRDALVERLFQMFWRIHTSFRHLGRFEGQTNGLFDGVVEKSRAPMMKGVKNNGQHH